MADFFRIPSFKSILIIFFVTYTSLLILIYFFQRSLQYFPSGSAVLPNGFEEIKLKTEDGLEIMIWQKIPKKYKKIIVYFHGNAGNIGDRSYRLETFIEKGYGIVGLSYRGYFGSQGSPSQSGLIEDSKAVMRYLSSKNIDKQDIILFGESLGSGVVVQIAANYSSLIKKLKPLANNEFSDSDEKKFAQNNVDDINSRSNFLSTKDNNNLDSESLNVYKQNSNFVSDNKKNSNELIEHNKKIPTQFFLVVLESPFFNIEEIAQKTYRILPVKLILKDRFDSNLYAPNIVAPVLFFHGDKDGVVPIASGRKLFSLITSRKKFVELRGSYHVDTNPDFLIEQIEDFTSQTLTSVNKSLE